MSGFVPICVTFNSLLKIVTFLMHKEYSNPDMDPDIDPCQGLLPICITLNTLLKYLNIQYTNNTPKLTWTLT